MKRSLATIDRRNERMIYLVVGADSEAERIPIYNQILRSASPVFKSLVEEMNPEETELVILDVSKKIMSILIEYIYQTFQDCEAHLPVTDTNVHDLYMAANKFDLDDVKSLCRDYLESIEINEENCIQLFLKNSESTSFNFRRCLEFILLSLGQLFTTQSFINLTATHLVLIIREGRATGKSSEDVLCEAAINWMKNRSQEISAEVKELIVEFPCKDHKTMILQALRKIPNPELQDFAFDLLLKLYTEESKSMTTNTTTTEIDADHNKTPSTSTTESCGNKSSDHDNQHTPDNNNNVTVTNSETTDHVTQIKRSSTPLPSNEEGLTCSPKPKRNKTYSKANDEFSSSGSSSSLNEAVNKISIVANSNEFCDGSSSSNTQKNGEVCSIDENNDTTRNNSNLPVKSIDTAQVTSLKRPSISSSTQEEASSCSMPKRNKMQSIASNESFISIESLSLPEAGKDVSVSPKKEVCCGTPNNEEGCTIFFLGRDGTKGHKVDLWTFNLHSSVTSRVNTTVPSELKDLKYSSLQYYRGRIYCMGSMGSSVLLSNNVHIFDVEKNSWTKVDILESRYVQGVCLDDSLFVFGDRQDKNKVQYIKSVEKFCLNTEPMNRELIELKEKFVQLRSYCGLVVFNDKIFTIGGEMVSKGGGWEVSGICQEFVPELDGKGQWKSIGPALNIPRCDLMAISTETEIYAIGGWTQHGDKSTAVEILRAGSDIWELGPTLIKARAHTSGVYCKEQHAIFVFGGDDYQEPTMEKLDLATGEWTLCESKRPMQKYFFSVAYRPCT